MALTIETMIARFKNVLDQVAGIGAVLLVRPKGSAETTSDLVSAKAGAQGGVAIEGVSGGDPVVIEGAVEATVSDVSTATNQQEQTGHIEDLPGVTTNFKLAVGATYNPDLRAIWNNGSGGVLTYKGSGNDFAQQIYLQQYEKTGLVQVHEVVAIDSGMDVRGGS